MPDPSFTDDREDWSARGGDANAPPAGGGSLRRVTSHRDVRWPEDPSAREAIDGWWRAVKAR